MNTHIPDVIIIIVFYSSKAQQLCWQGSKLSEYIQGETH